LFQEIFLLFNFLNYNYANCYYVILTQYITIGKNFRLNLVINSNPSKVTDLIGKRFSSQSLVIIKSGFITLSK
ncbi:hypothetical protein C1646_819417, partial [Rhizophagus diaphanus]